MVIFTQILVLSLNTETYIFYPSLHNLILPDPEPHSELHLTLSRKPPNTGYILTGRSTLIHFLSLKAGFIVCGIRSI